MDSILDSVKHKLGGMASDVTYFDDDLIDFINSVFSTLTQLGVGPEKGYSISDDTDRWEDYIGDDVRLEMVKTYMYLKVRLVFDPPQSGSVLQSINDQIHELEWRLNVAVDPKGEN